MHYQDFTGSRRGWTGAAVHIDPTLLAGRPVREYTSGWLVDVYGPPITVAAGVWSERTTVVRPWAQIVPVTGEIVYVTGVPRDATPEQVRATVEGWLSPGVTMS